MEYNIPELSPGIRKPSVRSDGEVHRVAGFELFAPICSPELLAIPARLYSRLDAFEILEIAKIAFQNPTQMLLAEHDHVISGTRDVCFQSLSRRMDFAMGFVPAVRTS